jgi:uncharacterized protein (DUF58 family)
MNQFVAWLDPVLEYSAQVPFLVLLLAALPLVAIAYFSRSFPSRTLVLLLVPACLATLLMLVLEDFFLLVIGIDIAVLLVALGDLLSLPRESSLVVERQVGRIASLKQDQRVTLTINHLGHPSQQVEIRDGVPQEFVPTPFEFSLRLAPRSRATVHYDLKATRRGDFRLNDCYVRARSRLGLWWRYFTYPVESVIHVYPDMKQIAEYEVLARTDRLSLLGVRRTRKIGQDNEFERLRDYSRDDNPRHIDWRSTARRNKLTVKDYQANQSQRVIFLLDCGRMMTNEAAGLSLLDHALNAMLMLSYVALRRGDSVGLVCFSDAIHSFVPPKSGLGHMNRLLHASFDRFPKLVESRYDQAFLHLATNCRKRSLVILMTNVIDEVNSLQIEQYMGNIVGRHLPLGVLLRDHRLFDAADQENPLGSELFRAGAAAEILTWRHQVITDLTHKGVLAVDTFPEEMTAPLINKYLEVKARHLL